ncbi:MAG: aspartate/glutamate racemase family protein, partial [Desulfobacterales bacterium]|nr:aspartate/glutamate racemase family protein [Desulfobacterales bacterium]
MKDPIHLLVTDSGLGGLSVYADVVEQLASISPCPRVKLTYFNAWPEPHQGYNHYPDMEFKARVFQNAMEAMARFQPQQILIACNTLSVIYEHTPFARSPQIPVFGIVDTGVEMIAKALKADPEAGVVIFGTPTTASSAVHGRALINRGISPDRIINQGCVNLAGTIERTPFSPEVETMVRDNAAQAKAQGADRFKTLYLALCCTHFGYRKELFIQAMEAATRARVHILNPNEAMSQNALAPYKNRDMGNAPEIM